MSGSRTSSCNGSVKDRVRLAALYGRGVRGLSNVKSFTSKHDDFTFTELDRINAVAKVVNSISHDLDTLNNVFNPVVEVADLQKMLMETLLIQFTFQEVVSLIYQFHCEIKSATTTVIRVNFPLFLTSFKLLRNELRDKSRRKVLQVSRKHSKSLETLQMSTSMSTSDVKRGDQQSSHDEILFSGLTKLNTSVRKLQATGFGGTQLRRVLASNESGGLNAKDLQCYLAQNFTAQLKVEECGAIIWHLNYCTPGKSFRNVTNINDGGTSSQKNPQDESSILSLPFFLAQTRLLLLNMKSLLQPLGQIPHPSIVHKESITTTTSPTEALSEQPLQRESPTVDIPAIKINNRIVSFQLPSDDRLPTHAMTSSKSEELPVSSEQMKSSPRSDAIASVSKLYARIHENYNKKNRSYIRYMEKLREAESLKSDQSISSAPTDSCYVPLSTSHNRSTVLGSESNCIVDLTPRSKQGNSIVAASPTPITSFPVSPVARELQLSPKTVQKSRTKLQKTDPMERERIMESSEFSEDPETPLLVKEKKPMVLHDNGKGRSYQRNPEAKTEHPVDQAEAVYFYQPHRQFGYKTGSSQILRAVTPVALKLHTVSPTNHTDTVDSVETVDDRGSYPEPDSRNQNDSNVRSLNDLTPSRLAELKEHQLLMGYFLQPRADSESCNRFEKRWRAMRLLKRLLAAHKVKWEVLMAALRSASRKADSTGDREGEEVDQETSCLWLPTAALQKVLSTLQGDHVKEDELNTIITAFDSRPTGHFASFELAALLACFTKITNKRDGQDIAESLFAAVEHDIGSSRFPRGIIEYVICSICTSLETEKETLKLLERLFTYQKTLEIADDSSRSRFSLSHKETAYQTKSGQHLLARQSVISATASDIIGYVYRVKKFKSLIESEYKRACFLITYGD